ncbi:hypothetical protein [Nonomuraea sp. B5E05]|uniref:hypothetical protein n=1 Tax=Nonomuraea sp. B5E05 TaxID=3153569 RepID=UPI003260D51F
MRHWEPYAPRTPRLRVHETSCCGEYDLASEGGQYFVLRWNGDHYEETSRGRYGHAVKVWLEVTATHHHQDMTA